MLFGSLLFVALLHFLHRSDVEGICWFFEFLKRKFWNGKRFVIAAGKLTDVYRIIDGLTNS